MRPNSTKQIFLAGVRDNVIDLRAHRRCQVFNLDHLYAPYDRASGRSRRCLCLGLRGCSFLSSAGRFGEKTMPRNSVSEISTSDGRPSFRAPSTIVPPAVDWAASAPRTSAASMPGSLASCRPSARETLLDEGAKGGRGLGVESVNDRLQRRVELACRKHCPRRKSWITRFARWPRFVPVIDDIGD